MRQAPTPLETDSATQPAEVNSPTETHQPAKVNPQTDSATQHAKVNSPTEMHQPIKANPPTEATPPTYLLELGRTVTPANAMTDPTKQYEFPAMDTDPVEDLDIPPVPTRERIDGDLAPFPDTIAINDKPATVTESTPMEVDFQATEYGCDTSWLGAILGYIDKGER
ncbi:unnamed protein product [Arabis nemorensis]|uniref:Uncharacterized protein n=1 Tax=Arabis nemorensis TaxID=586526 RepID=A0A565BUB9_9BRAS|nr:unnamed protein product [Arabis nemorensis]